MTSQDVTAFVAFARFSDLEGRKMKLIFAFYSFFYSLALLPEVTHTVMRIKF